MSSEVALRVRHLSKAYKIRQGLERHNTLGEAALARIRHPLARAPRERFLALDDISFDVSHGDVLGIIGHNGAGKSTLLKILSRITSPTAGEVHVYGRVGSLLEVGTGFHPELTGRENIYLNGNILGMRRREIDNRFDEIVDFSGVERFLDTPVKRYSSGMYVRLAFAVAAHLDTEILLIDEVLAVGDLAFQRRCLSKMEAAADEGRTVVFVSHSMETVSRLCRSGLLLSHGSVEARGSPRTIIERYVNDPSIAGGARTWPALLAPGDEEVRLRGVHVTDVEGRTQTQFDVRQPIRITVDYELTGDCSATPLVSLFFKNAEGVVLFASNSHHAIKRGAPTSGPVSAHCDIPGNFFAEGRHLVTVMLNSAGTAHIHEEDLVSFDVFDPCLGDSVRGDYTGDWSGYVRPMLDWTLSTPNSASAPCVPDVE